MVLRQIQFTFSEIPLVRFKVLNSVFLGTRNFGLDIHNLHIFLPTKNNENRQRWVRVSDGYKGSRGQESFETLTNVQDDLHSIWGSWLQQVRLHLTTVWKHILWGRYGQQFTDKCTGVREGSIQRLAVVRMSVCDVEATGKSRFE